MEGTAAFVMHGQEDDIIDAESGKIGGKRGELIKVMHIVRDTQHC